MMQKGRFIGILLLLFLCGFTVNANQQLTIDAGEIWLDEWLGQNLNLTVELGTGDISVEGSVERFVLPEPLDNISDIHFKCAKFEVTSSTVYCSDLRLDISDNDMNIKDINLSIFKNNVENVTRIKLNDFKVDKGKINLAFELKQDSWAGSIQGEQTDIAAVLELFKPFLSEESFLQFSAWDLAGEIDFMLNVSGQQDQLLLFDLTVNSVDFNFSDDEGQYVAEQLTFELNLRSTKMNDLWQWQHDLQLIDGQSYLEPIFFDFLENDLVLSAKGDWHSDKQYLNINSFQVGHNHIAQAKGYYSGTTNKAAKFGITIIDADLTSLYPIWLQPMLIQTAAARIDVAGIVSLEYEQIGDEYQLISQFSDVFIEDEENKFGIEGLSGTTAWTNKEILLENSFSWNTAHLYGLPIGSATVYSQVTSSKLSLQQPLQLPILDGQLQINDFFLQQVEEDHFDWNFDGLISPISMSKISQTQGWPILHGKISGVIPDVSYSQKQVNIDGALMVKLFNGTIIMHDLKLDKPLGLNPQLFVNVDLLDIDLELLTRTFDFGKITGRLGGNINNMRLANWEPVEFDAHFVTPEGDNSRRRISQKAVDNLAQIGGGPTGALSASFLRFFKDFSYQKIGINCYLQNDVCHMSGVEDAEQGYYIVKGGGLPPRINVLGHTREVDWPELIGRIQAVSNSTGPVIQ